MPVINHSDLFLHVKYSWRAEVVCGVCTLSRLPGPEQLSLFHYVRLQHNKPVAAVILSSVLLRPNSTQNSIPLLSQEAFHASQMLPFMAAGERHGGGGGGGRARAHSSGHRRAVELQRETFNTHWKRLEEHSGGPHTSAPDCTLPEGTCRLTYWSEMFLDIWVKYEISKQISAG